MRLQHAGEHDPDAVEHDLRHEHLQHPAADLQQRLAAGRVRTGQRAQQRRRQQDPERRYRREDQHRPGQQRARGAPGALTVTGGDRPGQQRDHERGERAAGDDLEHDVGQLVGALVGVADAPGAERAGEHGDPPEADHPGQHGHPGDARGRPDDRAAPHASRPSRSTQRSGGVASMTAE